MTSSPVRSRSRNRPPSPPAEQPVPVLTDTPPASPLFQAPEDLPTPPAAMEDPGPRLPSSDPGDLSVNAPDPASPSAIRSTDEQKKTPRLGRAALRRFAERAVLRAGLVAHVALTVAGSLEEQNNLWVPDHEDVTDIADPIAGLVGRRIPTGTSKNPDLEDGIMLVIAVATYIGKQLTTRAQLRAAAAAMPVDQTAGDVQTDAEQAAQ